MSPWWNQPTDPGDPGDEAEEPKAAAKKTGTRRRSPAKRPSGRKKPAAKTPAEKTPAKRTPNKKTRAKPASDDKKPAAKTPEKKSTTRRTSTRQTAASRASGRRSAGQKKPSPPRPPARTATGRGEPATHDLKFDSDVRPEEFERVARGIDLSPERTPSVSTEPKIALFCDLENIALGVRDSEIKKFDIDLVLERLLEKGKIIVKKAYADWERYSEYKRPFHEAAIEMIGIPQRSYSGKNSADIKMVVDALDLSYSKEHLDTFALLSGDSDFSPLVSKLKENNKRVLGIGVKNSSSHLLIDNCDEFIFYEDVWRDRQSAPKVATTTSNKKGSEAFSLMVDAIQALLRENKDVLWGSMIKQTMQRKSPSFNEGYYGYASFSDLLEDAEEKGLIKLKKDQRSGTYIVTGFAGKR